MISGEEIKKRVDAFTNTYLKNNDDIPFPMKAMITSFLPMVPKFLEVPENRNNILCLIRDVAYTIGYEAAFTEEGMSEILSREGVSEILATEDCLI